MGAQNSCLTLSHEGLAGVKEDLTTLDDHALDGQVFPDVLRLADFIVHDPGETGSKGHAVPLPGRGMPCSLGRPKKRRWGVGGTCR